MVPNYKRAAVFSIQVSVPVFKVLDHGRRVMSSNPVPLKTHRRVGQRYTLKLSRAETSSLWCGSYEKGVTAQDSFDQQLASPKPPTHFQWGLDLENALAIRDVEYPRCLDNPEQRVFDDMLRCRP
ncbi:hypothetical protein TNCV_1608831 [Trichonephila clavipes]|nr:hypothetical protein TNCV_1608831 [Trichonephila clavipes]